MAEQFEFFANGTELCSAHKELNEPNFNRNRSGVSQSDVQFIYVAVMIHEEDYYTAFEYGSPPTVCKMPFCFHALIMQIAADAVIYNDFPQRDNLTRGQLKNKMGSNVFRKQQLPGSELEPLSPYTNEWEKRRKT